jgi:hypothetical protein
MPPGPAVTIKPNVMVSVTATEVSVVPSCGQFRWRDFRQIGFPLVSTIEISIQIRSTVALALAAPADPKRATRLPIATAKNFRMVLSRRTLKML